jgi:hypothetical protein
MNELHEALDDIAAEITPSEPPVDLTMVRGRRMRNWRRAAFITGTGCTLALLAGAVAGIPVLAGHLAPPGTAPAPAGQGSVGAPGRASGSPLPVRPAGDALQVRPVLLFAPKGGTTAYGDARLVNTATMKLFGKLACRPGPNAYTVDDRWKGTVSYKAAQWNARGSEIVSCDATGNKYVLGKAVFGATDVTSIGYGLEQNTAQWVVDLTVNAKAAAAFGTLTTNQYNSYYAGLQGGNEDAAALDSTAIVINGDVQSAPKTASPITNGELQIAGPQPSGFTQAQARALAAQL